MPAMKQLIENMIYDILNENKIPSLKYVKSSSPEYKKLIVKSGIPETDMKDYVPTKAEGFYYDPKVTSGSDLILVFKVGNTYSAESYDGEIKGKTPQEVYKKILDNQ